MVIGFFINNSGIKDVDFSYIKRGNPGCGGTEYLFVLLASMLSENKNYNFIIYSTNVIKGVNNIMWFHANSPKEAFVHFSKKYQGGVLIIHPFQLSDTKNVAREIKIIVWHHNTINNIICQDINKQHSKVINVFLTKDQIFRYYKYKNMLSHSILIPNANVSSYNRLERNLSLNNVVFMGSISPQKNLHKLLLLWPKIIKKTNAHLIIIGSGQLYSRENKMGPMQITEEKYEKELIDIIETHNLSKYVFFVGIINTEEFEKIYAPITKVGIVSLADNESYSETFCLSATQMGSLGIPIIATKMGGIKYTLPNKCGYKVQTEKGLEKALLSLLTNDNKNVKYGNRYREYIRKHYDYSIVFKKWNNLLSNIDSFPPSKGHTLIRVHANYINIKIKIKDKIKRLRSFTRALLK